jgi:hypothetical protein
MDPAPGLNRSLWKDPVVWTGLALFGYQAVLALLFHLERTATADSAFFSFLLVESGLPVEALGRYGSWLAQLPALALIHLQAPLDLVLRTYSLSFVLIDVSVFLMLLRLRDREAALALPVVKTVAFHYTFYYGISELNQGLTLMVLAWALLKRWLDAGPRPWPWLLAALVVWSSFYHQLLVFPLAFALAVEGWRRALFGSRRWWAMAVLLVGWYAVRILLFTRSSYEAQRMPGVDELVTYGAALGELESTQHLLAVFPKFKAFLLLVLTTIALALWRRSWVLLAGTLLTSSGFMVLVLITDRDGASPNIYENYYTVQGYFWGLLFAVLACEVRVRRWIPVLLQASVLLLGAVQLWRAHALLSAHVRYAQRVTTTLRERGTYKAIADTRNFPWKYAWGEWPLAMETLLASGCVSPGSAATVFATTDAAPFDSVATRPNAFLGPSWNPVWFSTSNFPKAQLHLPRQAYVRMNTVMPDSIEALFTSGEVLLDPLADTITLAHDRYTVAEVRISNRSARTLGSLLEGGLPMRIAYHLLDADGKELLWDGHRSPLEMDIPPGGSHVQGLVIERPRENGVYQLRIDLVSDDRRWWGINVPMTVRAGR